MDEILHVITGKKLISETCRSLPADNVVRGTAQFDRHRCFRRHPFRPHPADAQAGQQRECKLEGLAILVDLMKLILEEEGSEIL